MCKDPNPGGAQGSTFFVTVPTHYDPAPADLPASVPADISEDELEVLADELSNWGRWGPDDERGTLNYIAARNVVTAAGSVRSGRHINLAHEIDKEFARLQLVLMQVNALEATDEIHISNHGPFNTHIDATGHMFYKGKLYNGRDADKFVQSDGIGWAGLRPMKDGIVTRAVFLDVAAARGLDYLPVEAGVTSEDLSAAEKLAGVTVEPGDAVIVRIGNHLRAQQSGKLEQYYARPGMMPESLRWLHERQVSLWGGDCADRNPNPYVKYPWPFHILSEAVMGLPLLHYIDAETLKRVCAEEKRNSFMLAVAPLKIADATGSPVSPIAIF